MKKVKIIQENVEFRCFHDEMKRVFNILIPESEILKRYINNPHAIIVDVCLEIAEVESLHTLFTKENLAILGDYEHENSNSVTFQTPKGKQVKYIKADILDKIRTEIEEYRDSLPWERNTIVQWSAINHILEQIIDKYR